MKVTYLENHGQAYFYAVEKIENRRSTRFLYESGEQITIKSDDILSVEDEEITFDELTSTYLNLWKKADAEKKATGKISNTTRKFLEKIADRLNK